MLNLKFSFTAQRDGKSLINMEQAFDCPDDIDAFKQTVRAAVLSIQDYLVADVTLEGMFKGEQVDPAAIAQAKYDEYAATVAAQSEAMLAARRAELGMLPTDVTTLLPENTVTGSIENIPSGSVQSS